MYMYILGNAKWLLSTTLPDGMYYEVTYNNREFYPCKPDIFAKTYEEVTE